jgi:hypothetical protein
MKVSTLAPITDLVVACEWPDGGQVAIGGPVSAEFSIMLPIAKRPAWLVKRAVAEVRMGGLPLLAGYVSEVDWINGGKVSIAGAATEGDGVPCLNAGGTVSSTPDTVLDNAITNAWISWNRPASISTTALSSGDVTLALNMITDMIGAFAQANAGQRLYVDSQRSIRVGADPTSPELFLVPGTVELPWTQQNQAATLIGRWQDASGVLSNTVVGSGLPVRTVDLTGKGPLTSSVVTVILNSLLVMASAGGWGGGATIGRNHSIGMVDLVDVFLRTARGLMVRNLGQRDPRPDRLPVPYVDFIVERAELHVADAQLILTPRGMVARDFSAILADLGFSEGL